MEKQDAQRPTPIAGRMIGPVGQKLSLGAQVKYMGLLAVLASIEELGNVYCIRLEDGSMVRKTLSCADLCISESERNLYALSDWVGNFKFRKGDLLYWRYAPGEYIHLHMRVYT
jgi:hypothetical protein